MPKFNSISISGYHMQEAGATADLELAYTLADGVEYIRTGIEAGRCSFVPRLSSSLLSVCLISSRPNCGRRGCLAKLPRQHFGITSPKALMLRTHCQTSGWSLAARDVYNNVIRTLIEASVVVVGKLNRCIRMPSMKRLVCQRIIRRVLPVIPSCIWLVERMPHMSSNFGRQWPLKA